MEGVPQSLCWIPIFPPKFSALYDYIGSRRGECLEPRQEKPSFKCRELMMLVDVN
jgi:hypothetical protein